MVHFSCFICLELIFCTQFPSRSYQDPRGREARLRSYQLVVRVKHQRGAKKHGGYQQGNNARLEPHGRHRRFR